MVVICLLVGCLMVAGGVTAVTTGMGFIVLERGWSMVIAGSVVATGGALLIGIALLIREIRRLPMHLATYDQPEEWEEAEHHARRVDGASHEEHAAGYQSVNEPRTEAFQDDSRHDDSRQASAAVGREERRDLPPPVRSYPEPVSAAPVSDTVPAAVRGSIAGAAATAALATAAPVVVAAATRKADGSSDAVADVVAEEAVPLAEVQGSTVAGADRAGLDRALASVEEAFAASFDFAPAAAGKTDSANAERGLSAEEKSGAAPEPTHEIAPSHEDIGGREPAVDPDAFLRDLTADKPSVVEPEPAASAPEPVRPSLPSWFSPSRFGRAAPQEAPAAEQAPVPEPTPAEPLPEAASSGVEADAAGLDDRAAEVADPEVANPEGSVPAAPERPPFPDFAVSRDAPPAPDMGLPGTVPVEKTAEQTAAERKARWSLFRRRSEAPASSETDAERAARIAAAALAVTPNRSFAGEEPRLDMPDPVSENAAPQAAEDKSREEEDVGTREAPWRGMTPVNEERAYVHVDRPSAIDDDRLPPDTGAPLADEERESVRSAAVAVEDDEFFSGGGWRREEDNTSLPQGEAPFDHEASSQQLGQTEVSEGEAAVAEELTVEDEPASSEFIPDPVPTVVGTYSAGGNLYVMFSDGSIEAETSRGTYRFRSLDELKAYVAASEEGDEGADAGAPPNDERQETEAEGNVPWTTPRANA
ncbi:MULTISPECIES: hypothetical protein [unclassified Chelatococcus]|uniref:hypothetical protein n=1 Tax=unclassified Chelatococcus TaxID=2638111 RepID=UPI001BCB35A5|nr:MULTISPECIES: hypothetical protein [unclassified Chelatococcus]MBS7739349.1 hypothetical protein [Chelatococcus sp. HY11]MBX3546628.1 hypothetical protein [Chelatococcus sp.]MCO5076116.1 hypothetical protein [Chelatococcus sp.]